MVELRKRNSLRRSLRTSPAGAIETPLHASLPARVRHVVGESAPAAGATGCPERRRPDTAAYRSACYSSKHDGKVVWNGSLGLMASSSVWHVAVGVDGEEPVQRGKTRRVQSVEMLLRGQAGERLVMISTRGISRPFQNRKSTSRQTHSRGLAMLSAAREQGGGHWCRLRRRGRDARCDHACSLDAETSIYMRAIADFRFQHHISESTGKKRPHAS